MKYWNSLHLNTCNFFWHNSSLSLIHIYWVRTLKDDFYQPLGEIQWEAFRTNEQLSLGEAKKEQFVSVKPGFTWGNTYEYCWMKGHIQLSEEAEGKRIVMNLKPDGEATLFVNDKAFGTYRASWVNEPHHYIVDLSLIHI